MDYAFDKNYGVVARLYPTRGKTYFKLVGGQTAMDPIKDYYFIPVNHDNYTALINLLYKAAENRWKIKVRTKEKLNSDGYAEVIYFVVDWLMKDN